VLATGLLIAIVALSPTLLSLIPTSASYVTAVGEIREVSLEDGSKVTLSARSAIATRYSRSERRVTLADGEAFFQVSKDADRPFLVFAGNTIVRVTGTQFDVRKGATAVRVSVVEGVVEVGRVDMDEASRTTTVLKAGEQVAVASDGASSAVGSAPAGSQDSWRRGRLVYEDAALSDVIEDANRYYAPGIVLADRSLGEMRVTASFQTDQIEQVINALPASRPVEVHKLATAQMIIRRRSRAENF
jgi:transmembrane sensor